MAQNKKKIRMETIPPHKTMPESSTQTDTDSNREKNFNALKKDKHAEINTPLTKPQHQNTDKTL